jgi:hypothetical protein
MLWLAGQGLVILIRQLADDVRERNWLAVIERLGVLAVLLVGATRCR